MKKIEKKLAALPLLEEKALYFQGNPGVKARKRWYKDHYKSFRRRIKAWKMIGALQKPWLPKLLDFARWVLIDIIRCKPRKFWGIYQFVALPGEGKTLSMVAHMERAIKHEGREKIYIATNFGYVNEDMQINHWMDIIKAAVYARIHGLYCIIAVDEIHTTFDSSDWKSFPAEMLALLSFNRKYGMQFLCSAQIYDRIPKKVRDIANYTVICKNTLSLDRHFVNYYFSKSNYEDKFSGKRRLCDMIYTYVADDHLFSLYDTLRQVERMTDNAQKEDDKRLAAFHMLFGNTEAEGEGA